MPNQSEPTKPSRTTPESVPSDEPITTSPREPIPASWSKGLTNEQLRMLPDDEFEENDLLEVFER